MRPEARASGKRVAGGYAGRRREGVRRDDAGSGSGVTPPERERGDDHRGSSGAFRKGLLTARRRTRVPDDRVDLGGLLDDVERPKAKTKPKRADELDLDGAWTR
jgi:hypothetical protein